MMDFEAKKFGLPAEYETPEWEIVKIPRTDVITASSDTITLEDDEEDIGFWRKGV